MGVKVLLKYVDDFVRTVNRKPELVLQAANNPVLQVAVEIINEKWPFGFESKFGLKRRGHMPFVSETH